MYMRPGPPTRLFRLPPSAGGGTWPAVAIHETQVLLTVDGFAHPLRANIGDLVEVTPPLPPEPGPGHVVIDERGRAWQRARTPSYPEDDGPFDGDDLWYCTVEERPATWPYVATLGPVELVRRPTPTWSAEVPPPPEPPPGPYRIGRTIAVHCDGAPREGCEWFTTDGEENRVYRWSSWPELWERLGGPDVAVVPLVPAPQPEEPVKLPWVFDNGTVRAAVGFTGVGTVHCYHTDSMTPDLAHEMGRALQTAAFEAARRSVDEDLARAGELAAFMPHTGKP